MLNERDFTKSIWDKYEQYFNSKDKDKFFSKHVYKNVDFALAVKTICTILLTITTSFGIAYAGITTYNYVQTQTKTNFENNSTYDYNQNMTYQNGVYYKKILSYEDYIKSKKIWENLVDINKDEFNDYFILVIAGENYSTTGLEINNSSVDKESNTLYIELIKKSDEVENTVISTKIPIKENMDNIKIIIKNEKPELLDYESIEKLPKEYSKQQAIKDNCFVISNNKVISNDKKQLDEFIEKSTKGENVSIRIAIYFDSELTIKDIEYKDGKYIICDDDTRGETGKIYYRTGNTINTRQTSFGRMVWIEDKVGNQIQICNIQ